MRLDFYPVEDLVRIVERSAGLLEVPIDGDGAMDLLQTTGSRWQYSSGASGPWTTLNSSSYTLGGMLLGDFTGDGTTDIVIRVSDADAMQARQHVEREAQTIIDEAVATRQAYRSFAVDNWGNGRLSALFTGRRVRDDELEMLARQERRVFSPGAMGRYVDREWDADVREVLPMIQSPTLVLHRANNQLVDPGQGRYITEHIPGARHAEVQGSAHVPFHGDTEPLLAEIREFLTGHREAARVDRVLATILFTDIVDSTRQAADLGDHRWRQLLDEHDAATAAAVERFDGRVVKSTGDGALATFASPGRAIAAAKAIATAGKRTGLQVRAGLHTGECELRGDDVGGIAVHIAARVAALAGPGELLVSRTVTDLVVGAYMTFADAGEHELKGVPGTWPLFSVE